MKKALATAMVLVALGLSLVPNGFSYSFNSQYKQPVFVNCPDTGAPKTVCALGGSYCIPIDCPF